MQLTIDDRTRRMLNKVPEITIFFWIIKVLATTVGETAADYLNFHLGLGLANTTWIMTGLLVLALVFQLVQRRYIPWIYWLAVVLISVVGTLITDNLSDNLGVPLVDSTIGFGLVLAITFALWYAVERTLSIHSIITTRRELFYWAAILFTFALGTAGGDFASEGLNWGYWQAGLIFGGAIAVIAALYSTGRMNGILAFWLAYILTRPLGASMGDLMTAPRGEGGFALGTTGTSAIFLVVIVALVAYLTVSRVDRIEQDAALRAEAEGFESEALAIEAEAAR